MNGRTVLLAEDSDLVAEVVSEALGQAGFEVHRAEDGYDAIERCYKLIPDVIVMDIDMPMLKGYQASRLLKRRRGVRDIPIIMHTANSEDKDRFWSYNSGASAFVVKDFHNIDALVEAVRKNIRAELPGLAHILEDAKSVTRESIAEAVSNMLDADLFRSTIVNQLSDAGRSIASLPETAERVLELLDLACDRHAGILVLRSGRDTLPFVYPSRYVNKEIAEDFLAVSLDDFYSLFDRKTMRNLEPLFFNLEGRDDWNKLRLDHNQLCSYYHLPLKGAGDQTVGTLHIAHSANNYFTDAITENIHAFAEAAGIILHNALMFRHVSTMESEIRNVFSKFVPQEIINELVARKTNEAMLAGEKRELVILFSDIRSFTTLSETNPPEVVVSFLNRYLERMCAIITEHGGMVDKFIGDAILAVFGAPKSWPDNARRATETALAMSRAIREFDTTGIRLPPGGLDIGLGLHLGDAIVGTIGSATKFDYTVIGDTVNLASRLEGLSKSYKVRVIVSERVAAQLSPEDRARSGIRLREIERVIVKGKEEPTLIYLLEDEDAVRLDDEASDSYKKALSMYRLRNWKTAGEYFAEVCQRYEGDPVSAMFLERCRAYQDVPPADDWDLVQRYYTK